MNVLFATSELAPYVKTGGLADVSDALPRALRALGVDARVLIPGYPRLIEGLAELRQLAVLPADGPFPQCQILAGRSNAGVPVLAVQCMPFYERMGGPYQDGYAQEWPDNAPRFALLAKVAALIGSAESPIGWRADVVHANDWQTGLAPAYLHFMGRPAASVVTIHNLAFQGCFDAGLVELLGLPGSAFSIDGVEFHGRFSFLKAGLYYADRLTTVSPGYATEIRFKAHGYGMHGLLEGRSDVLSGIVNGIDTDTWNPAADRHLLARYDETTLELKRKNTRALRAEAGLADRPDLPLCGVVSRLAHQKGIDLILDALPALRALPAQLIVLGAGDPDLQTQLSAAAAADPDNISFISGVDEGLAHRIEAGADFFLMPSRYEPCGLNQMYSQRYGTPPIVHVTGGLGDTVEDGVTGLCFAPFTLEGFVAALHRAVALFRTPLAYRRMQRAGMLRRFGWTESAAAYRDIYASLLDLNAAGSLPRATSGTPSRRPRALQRS